jgi:hypothetical protein
MSAQSQRAMARNASCHSVSTVGNLSFPNTRDPGKSTRSEHLELPCHPLVMVREPTDFWDGHHLPPVRTMDGTRFGTIHGQGQIGPPAMGRGNIACEETREMPLMEDDHMVQTSPADTPHQALI